ncbi:MAG: PilZ domain-containing protein [Nitrospinales bacterium]
MRANFRIEMFRRTSPRKDYRAEVSFSAGVMCFSGMLENVSTGGALLVSNNLDFIQPGREITITIPFAEKQGSIKRNAIVIRTEGNKLGIEFA